MADKDILDDTCPEGIPGALFDALVTVVLARYQPGTIVNTLPGATAKAKLCAIDALAVLTAYYEKVAADDHK